MINIIKDEQTDLEFLADLLELYSWDLPEVVDEWAYDIKDETTKQKEEIL